MSYVVSENNIVHNLDNLKEQCNTDQIVNKIPRAIEVIIEMKAIGQWKYCKYCMPDTEKELQPIW